MNLTVTGTITPSVPVNGVVTLTFTDTTTGITGLMSRTLVIQDDLGNVVQNTNMGSNLTATFNINADAYFTFIETIIDGGGTSDGEIAYTSTAFYNFTFPPLVAAIPTACDTFGQILNLTTAELYKNSALTLGAFGQGVNSNTNIIQANFYLNTPYYA